MRSRKALSTLSDAISLGKGMRHSRARSRVGKGRFRISWDGIDSELSMASLNVIGSIIPTNYRYYMCIYSVFISPILSVILVLVNMSPEAEEV